MVKEYKYLGFWFTTRNAYTLQIRKMAAKVRKAMNAVWGVWKRAGIRTMREKLYLMDVIVKAGCLYGVEIWGWDQWEAIERVQGRYVKMALGVNINTPNYIWEMEAGRDRLEVNNFSRAGKYLREIGKMGEERWPKICLREEVRAAKNGDITKWSKMVKKALASVGDGESWDEILNEEERGKVKENLERGAKIKQEQRIQANWGKIERSSYCREYGEWKKELGCEKYLQDKKWSNETKEQWARLRCGNLGREKSKGFKEDKCRVCGDGKENMEHIWVCQEARKEMRGSWIGEVEEKGLGKSGEEFRRNLGKVLKGEPVEGICNYARKFEEIAKIKGRIREGGSEGGRQAVEQM